MDYAFEANEIGDMFPVKNYHVLYLFLKIFKNL